MFMIKISRIITTDEIYNFFSNDNEQVFKFNDGSMNVNYYGALAEISPHSLMFNVVIKSPDDPLDSDEMITDEPLKFISEFLETGTAGDEFFNKMSSDSFIRRFESIFSEKSNKIAKTAANRLRRLALSVDADTVEQILFDATRVASKYIFSNQEFVEEEFNELKIKASEKGWKVTKSNNNLQIDISGIYEVEISVYSISWSYSFMVEGHNDTKEEGIVDDPIMAFQQWYKGLDSEEKNEGETRPLKGSDA